MAQGCLTHYGWAAFTHNPSCYWQWPNKAALDIQEFEKLWKADWFRCTWRPPASQAKTPIHLQKDWNTKFVFTQTNEHQLSAKRRIHSILFAVWILTAGLNTTNWGPQLPSEESLYFSTDFDMLFISHQSSYLLVTKYFTAIISFNSVQKSWLISIFCTVQRNGLFMANISIVVKSLKLGLLIFTMCKTFLMWLYGMIHPITLIIFLLCGNYWCK